MKNILKKSLFIVGAMLLISSASSWGQRNPNGNPPFDEDGKPGLGPKNSVPIDGGAGILLAAGAAYGLKKLRDSRKKNTPTDPSA